MVQRKAAIGKLSITVKKDIELLSAKNFSERKNRLSCGNDASSYRAAIVYSLIASCRAADVDPRQWLEHVLIRIPSRRKTDQSMEDLLPNEYAKRYDIKPWNLPVSD
ncbi:MAG: transposase domain-containing protein [Bacteroides sp.]|nr:transposase domain-containing protein [Bacteroides sp.]